MISLGSRRGLLIHTFSFSSIRNISEPFSPFTVAFFSFRSSFTFDICQAYSMNFCTYFFSLKAKHSYFIVRCFSRTRESSKLSALRFVCNPLEYSVFIFQVAFRVSIFYLFISLRLLVYKFYNSRIFLTLAVFSRSSSPLNCFTFSSSATMLPLFSSTFAESAADIRSQSVMRAR